MSSGSMLGKFSYLKKMNTVGRIGSFIGRGVYNVSGTFHPFGGAVDIIVVEQPDGKLKSSPWYVRFGKFQGILKVKEKVVNISVNGVEADFHMYLDSRGQAYFLKEMDIEDEVSSCPPSSSGEDTDGQTSSKQPIRSKSCNYADSNSTTKINVSDGDVPVRTNSRRSGILGLVFGSKSMKDNRPLEEDSGAGVVRADSLERAEIAADLLEMKWSTNLTTTRYTRDHASRFSTQDTIKSVKDEDLQINDRKMETSSLLHDDMLENPDFSVPPRENSVKETGKDMLCPASKNATRLSTVVQGVECYSREETLTSSGNGDELGVGNADNDASGLTIISNLQVVDSTEPETHGSFPATCLSKEENEADKVQRLINCETKISTAALDVSIEQVTQNFSEPCAENREVCMHAKTLHSMDVLLLEGNSQPKGNLLVEKDPSKVQGFEKDANCFKDGANKTYPDSACKDQDQKSSIEYNVRSKLESSSESLNDHIESSDSFLPLINHLSKSLEEEQLLFGDIDDSHDTVARNTESISSDNKEKEVYPPMSSGVPGCIEDYFVLNYEHGPTVDNSIQSDPQLVADGRKLKTVSSEVDIPASRIVQDNEVMRMARSLPNMWSHDNGLPSSPDDQTSSIVPQTIEDVKVAEEVTNMSATPEIENDSRSVSYSRESWRSWSVSFRRSRNMKISGAEDGNSDAKSISNYTDGDSERDVSKPKISKKKIRVNTPTSEQLETLNLKEGKNIVVFTFSTAMLGKQQVDARIFLWRWDSKIVISDVDGTITRSDVLGQFMPLVGVDWSQTGVVHLFSAIKENGYQMLYLSARAISQAYLTRQFLGKIMQNGKGLPDGPVLISPDGLFPSLFREVVRRAPHEFKIPCLQDVRALFPSDRNPFYAGFGNRDSDELSYLKVGIPKGKIFTINPKGQIVVDHHIDTKSYTSLHALVNGMFPPKSSCEQEDFNSWNYWKLPPPT